MEHVTSFAAWTRITWAFQAPRSASSLLESRRFSSIFKILKVFCIFQVSILYIFVSLLDRQMWAKVAQRICPWTTRRRWTLATSGKPGCCMFVYRSISKASLSLILNFMNIIVTLSVFILLCIFFLMSAACAVCCLFAEWGSILRIWSVMLVAQWRSHSTPCHAKMPKILILGADLWASTSCDHDGVPGMSRGFHLEILGDIERIEKMKNIIVISCDLRQAKTATGAFCQGLFLPQDLHLAWQHVCKSFCEMLRDQSKAKQESPKEAGSQLFVDP